MGIWKGSKNWLQKSADCGGDLAPGGGLMLSLSLSNHLKSPIRQAVMESDNKKSTERRPLIVNSHKKRSLNTWLLPLLVIIAIMVFLPRVIEKLN